MRKLVFVILVLAIVSSFAYACTPKEPENGPVNTERVEQELEDAANQPDEPVTTPEEEPEEPVDETGDGEESISDAAGDSADDAEENTD